MIILGLLMISCFLFSAEKYAVLITGCSADGLNAEPEDDSLDIMRYIRNTVPDEVFWNDTFLMWEMLIDKGYDNDNIFILYPDSLDVHNSFDTYRYDVPPLYNYITDFQADSSSVVMVLQGLANGNSREDIPQLQADDFLMIWTHSHGQYITHADGSIGSQLVLMNYDEKITDEDFGDLVDSINCQKKVIFMQQCLSGSFVSHLADEHSIIFTATSDTMPAFPDDALYYNAIDHPGDFTPGDSCWAYERDYYSEDGHEFRHGEYNLHLLNALKGETPSSENEYQTLSLGNFPLIEADVNQDALCSIDEASNWVYLFNSCQVPYLHIDDNYYWDIPQYSDDGAIGATTSLEYPNILNADITTPETLMGIIGVTESISIGNDVVIMAGAKIDLLNQSSLVVEEGATLTIGDNCIIRGNNLENSINVYGDIVIGDDVIFTGIDNEAWGGLSIHNEALEYDFSNVYFDHCNLSSISESLTLTNCSFENALLKYQFGDLFVDASEFINATLKVNNPSGRRSRVDIVNSNFQGITSSTPAIKITAYPVFNIANNYIYDNNDSAIYLYEAGGCYGLEHNISGNEITHNLRYGVFVYHSYVNVSNDNMIAYNNKGILGMHNSNIKIRGNDGVPYQQISHNFTEEIAFDHSSFPTYCHYNWFVDNDDYYRVSCFGHPNVRSHDITHNYWGIDFNPRTHLNPPDGFIYNPVWEFNNAPASNTPADMYELAKEYTQSEDYAFASEIYHDIIDLYPETKFALASAKELLSLEDYLTEDYTALQAYLSALDYDEETIKLAGYLSNYCNIKKKEYPTAIDYFEEIIANSPSQEDSIYAVIDAGYTYLLMEADGDRASYVGNLPSLKPASKEKFEQTKIELLAKLFDDSISQPGENNQPDENESVEMLSILIANFPNPFTGETTISFSLTTNLHEKARIEIYNIRGQKVETLQITNSPNQQIVWNANNFANGVYFYKLVVDGKPVDTKKMILLK